MPAPHGLWTHHHVRPHFRPGAAGCRLPAVRVGLRWTSSPSPAGLPTIRLYDSETRPNVRYRVQRVAGRIVHDAVAGFGLTIGCPGWMTHGHCWHIEAFEEDEDAALRAAAAVLHAQADALHAQANALTRDSLAEVTEPDPFARFDDERRGAA